MSNSVLKSFSSDTFLPAAAVVLTILAVSGCGYLRPARDHVPARAVPAMIAAQTLNPEAGKNHKVVTGLDGTVAQNVNASYAKSFVKTGTGGTTSAQNFQGLSGVGGDN